MSDYSFKKPLMNNSYPTCPAPVQCLNENVGYKHPPSENTMSGKYPQRPEQTENVCNGDLCECLCTLCICMTQLVECLSTAIRV